MIKNSEKKIKFRIMLLIICMLTIAVSFFKITYAYFNAKIIEKDKTETIIKSDVLNLIYNGNQEITEYSMIPGDVFTKTFSVENTSTRRTVTYNIYMENIINDFGDNLVYTLSDEDGVIIDTSELPSTQDKAYLTNDLEIEAKAVKNYTLTIEYKYLADVDQSGYMGTPFNATVGIDTKVLNHTLTLNTSDPSLGNIELNIKNGEPYGELPTPAKKGYTFTGWYTADGTKIEETTIVDVDSAQTLYAKYDANTYTITFDNGDGTTTTEEVSYDDTYGNLPTPEKEGYTFAGWYTDENYTNEVTSDTTVNTADNQTLYAKYDANTYTITFDSNGAEDTGTTIVVTYDGTYGELPELSRTGYQFDGWYLDEEYTEEVTSDTKVDITENKTLYAKWTANTYTVTFNNGDGTTTTKEVSYDDTYGELPTPEKEGYTFVGWYTDENYTNQVLSTTKYTDTQGKTLYAKWGQNTYTITFNNGDGTTTTKEVIYDEPYGELPAPEKEGYTFNGWYTDENYTNEITSDTNVSTANNQTLVAKYTANTYTISFDANGGDAISTIMSVTYDSTYGSLPTATYAGHIFEGWYLDKGYAQKITNDTKVSITENKTLYAKWSAAKYTVTFNAGTGSVSPETKEVTYDDTYGELPTPTLTGYTFKGWYTNTDYTTQITSSTKVSIITDQTLFAKYEANTYTISFDANGGNAISSTITVKYDGKYEGLPTPTRTGYTFNGWFTDTNYTTEITNATKVTTTSNQTLYAKWTANTYTVTFNADGGTSSANTKTVTYDSTYGDVPTPTRTGYTFAGWFTDKNYTTQITDTTKVTTTSNQTLYAKWTANSYTVTFNANGGSVTTTSKTVTYANIYGDLPTPTLTGYTFAGWYTASSGGTQINSGTTVTITEAQTLYAHWTANTDTAYKVIHWQQNIGGTASSHDSTNYTAAETESLTGTTGASITPAVKSYTGFTAPSTQKTTIAANGSTTVNYYYTRNSYTVTVNKSTGVSATTGSGTYQYGASVKIGYTIATGYTYSKITGDKTTTSFTMPASNVTMQVNATANSYTVTFNANGGSVTTTSKTVTYDSTYGDLPTPTRTGYTFKGWYTSTSYTTQVTSSTKVAITANQTLYAKWSANTYIVSFNANGGNSISTTLTATYDSTYGSLPTPTRTGYTFKGWYTATSGGTQITSSTKVSITAAQTLYAHWTINTYAVTISTTNASSSATSVSVTYGSTNTVTITPSSGYYLSSVSCTNGYTTNASTGVDKYDAQTITISNNSKAATSTCTFTASRINSSSLTYSNSATTKTNVQDAIDELYTKLK